jgi:hypothetical protein
MTHTQKRIFRSSAIAAIASFAACTSLDVSNPNAASEPQVVGSTEGIQALAVGLQQYYAGSVLGTLIIDTGLGSRELAANSTFLGQVILENGGTAMDGSLADLGTILGNEMNVMRIAERIIDEAPKLPFEAGTRSGIMALAHLYKAKAIGDLTIVFEKVPTQTDTSQRAAFYSRNEALAAAIAHLDSASALITATPTSTTFNTKIVGTRLDLANTINAYRARYLLFSGSYQAAIAAANRVNSRVASYFTYNATNLNPVFTNVVQARTNAPRDSLGTPLAERGDARITFFLAPDAGLSNPSRVPIDRLTGFFATNISPIPAYVPGEMALIRAEADVQLGDLSGAVTEINFIRTKRAADDPVGLGANLPPYSGPVTASALLTEIYRQRAAELYLQALRFEDARRLGRPGPPASLAERNRNYWPYPNQERQNNPNTPPDPNS